MTDNAGLNQLCFIQFGDPHITTAQAENYEDLCTLIQEVNQGFAGFIDFAYLPGDNADDAMPEQYELVTKALSHLTVAWHAIIGDHDQRDGSTSAFTSYLESEPWRAITIRNFRLLFLNTLDHPVPKTFDLGQSQLEWLGSQLAHARQQGLRPLLFMHLYPSELATASAQLRQLIQQAGVELVAMGHTHYNELANDGQTIYEATRSTGQIEEGPPGFSVISIHGDVLAWKFRLRGEWPFVMITSPSDVTLITRPQSPQQVVNGPVDVCARVWSVSPIKNVTFTPNEAAPQPMQRDGAYWRTTWHTAGLPDGHVPITVEVFTSDGRIATDTVQVAVNHHGSYITPERHPIDVHNVVPANPAKGILGTQLGPNKNGTKGPWPSWREGGSQAR